MQHTMPCVGFAVREKRGPNRLRVDAAEALVERNRVALRERYGRGYKKVQTRGNAGGEDEGKGGGRCEERLAIEEKG